MADSTTEGQAQAAEAAPETGGTSPLGAEPVVDEFAQRPEVFVGAAFAGGFVVAQILKRFRRG